MNLIINGMNMKKSYLIAGLSLLLLGTTFQSCNASNKKESKEMEEPTEANEAAAEISAPKGKILIAYFTMPETDGVDAVAGASRVRVNDKLYSNTQYVAEVIQEATGGDLFVIKTVQQYPGTHKELVDFAKVENEKRTQPKLSTHITNLNDYDVIFIGFPNWWYDMPMPMYTFFDEYNFSGKTIIPFCTHGGSRFSKAQTTIAELEKDAKMVKGLSISRDNVKDSKAEVLMWLKKIGMTE
jgi:flavodoxin